MVEYIERLLNHDDWWIRRGTVFSLCFLGSFTFVLGVAGLVYATGWLFGLIGGWAILVLMCFVFALLITLFEEVDNAHL